MLTAKKQLEDTEKRDLPPAKDRTGPVVIQRWLERIPADQPLVKVNCAALKENLLESELFGYVKGTFTGADKNKPGRFQEADKSTLPG